MAKKAPASESLKCEYCGKQYKLESAFAKHTCKQKERVEARGSKAVALGLHAFNFFYKRFHGGTKNQTVEKFEKSPYYAAFVKFGIYCASTTVIAPEKFAEWLVENKVRVDMWASDRHYKNFLIQYLRVEPIADALERAITFSIKWAEEKNMQACDVLRYGSQLKITIAIESGTLSPWVLYLTQSGSKFLNQLEDVYLEGIWPYINSDEWHRIIQDRKEDAAYAKNILKLAGW